MHVHPIARANTAAGSHAWRRDVDVGAVFVVARRPLGRVHLFGQCRVAGGERAGVEGMYIREKDDIRGERDEKERWERENGK